MSKRGPKSERRAAKQKAQQAQTQTQQQQQPPQHETQTAEQPISAAVEEASQRQAATPLAEQPVSTGDGATTVGDRILPRILLFSGVPVSLGLLLLPGFYYLKVCIPRRLTVYDVPISYNAIGTDKAGFSR